MKSSGDYDDSPFAAELYDHVQQYQKRRDVPFWVRAATDAGGPVLELGCGTGRTLIPTAQAGVPIVGIDRSAHMLRVCGEHLATLPDRVRSCAQLVQGDMRQLPFEPSFELVTAPFRVFQFLLTTEEQIACLQSAHRVLKPRSRMILDLSFPSSTVFSKTDVGVEFAYDAEVVLPDGRRVQRRHRYIRKDRLLQTIDFHVIYVVTHPDGRSERLIQRFSMRYLYRYEAEHLLKCCGFETQAVWAGYDKEPFGTLDPCELIIEATKL